MIGDTGVTLVLAQLLRAELDVVQPLQLAVIGLLKHLSYPSGAFDFSVALAGVLVLTEFRKQFATCSSSLVPRHKYKRAPQRKKRFPLLSISSSVSLKELTTCGCGLNPLESW